MPPQPAPALSIGVTGHRRVHPSYPTDDTTLLAAIERVFRIIEARSRAHGAARATRLHTLLADGTDQEAADLALALGWELVAPLPFGRALNRTIVAHPDDADEARRLIAGARPLDPARAALTDPIIRLEEEALVFEIADRDGVIGDLLVRRIEDPGNTALSNQYLFETARRFALGARVIVEQSDLLVAVWDGVTTANIGGTGDTVRVALHEGVPVLRIDPADPDSWCLITSSEMLAAPPCADAPANRDGLLDRIVAQALGSGDRSGFADLANEQWRDSSSFAHHAYRRVEMVFGSSSLGEKLKPIRQKYERPDDAGTGSGAPLVAALVDSSPKGSDLPRRIVTRVLARLAWADGIATNLSDRYRSGMVVNFLLGAVAIVAGVLYLPLGGPEKKWIFALVELTVLLAIVVNTALGTRRQLHRRWFATRRSAEYLRQLPLMLAAGVARPAGQWPHDGESFWPELFARQSAREVGLPEGVIDSCRLRIILEAVRDLQVVPQRDYHQAKAQRLARVHHRLDRSSEWLFAAAIIAVSIYLVLAALQQGGLFPSIDLVGAGKWLTVAGVALPTAGGAFAGVRYFGDFERFADISQVTARRLDEIAGRIDVLARVPDEALHYQDVADLLRATDAVVLSELASWQAVFSGKRIAVPV